MNSQFAFYVCYIYLVTNYYSGKLKSLFLFLLTNRECYTLTTGVCRVLPIYWFVEQFICFFDYTDGG
jgi:hypothetical protein